MSHHPTEPTVTPDASPSAPSPEEAGADPGSGASPAGEEAPGGPSLDSVRIVLDEPQNLVNVAAMIRVMKNMGLSRLRVVNPAEWDAWRITGIAHRCDDLVDATEHFDSLEEALADCVLVVGTSARSRTAHRNYGYARDWAAELVSRGREGPVAVVFGREDRGLSNQALDLCDGVAIIPTDPSYSSLNLAQAGLVLAYEMFLAAQADLPPLPRGKRTSGPATRERMETMFRALEEAMDRVEFFHAREAEPVMRTFRTLLSRADLDQQEAGLVQAMGFEVRKYIDRMHEGKEGRDGER
jgi:TrmH family RNA methyltransferase